MRYEINTPYERIETNSITVVLHRVEEMLNCLIPFDAIDGATGEVMANMDDEHSIYYNEEMIYIMNGYNNIKKFSKKY